MTDPSTLKTIIKRNMELLSQAGLHVTAWDVQAAFIRARDKKVLETFGSLFNSLSLEELGVASGVIDEMRPQQAAALSLEKAQSSTAAPATSPPAPSPRATTKPKRK